MYKKGVVKVDDLLDDNGCFLSFLAFKNKFSLDLLPFTTYYGIISAIPRHWKDNMALVNTKEEMINTDLSLLRSRHIYNSLISTIAAPPTAIRKWNGEFSFDDSQWQTIFRIPFLSCRESKIRYFQFRFLHRILGTNYLRYKMKLTDNARCNFCGSFEETLDHLFWGCQITSSFILDLEQRIFGFQFVFSKRDILFGYKLIPKHPYNFLIFHLKYYIFSQKMKDKVPHLTEFMYKFKFLLQVEKRIEKSNARNIISYEDMYTAFRTCCTLFETP